MLQSIRASFFFVANIVIDYYTQQNITLVVAMLLAFQVKRFQFKIKNFSFVLNIQLCSEFIPLPGLKPTTREIHKQGKPFFLFRFKNVSVFVKCNMVEQMLCLKISFR